MTWEKKCFWYLLFFGAAHIWRLFTFVFSRMWWGLTLLGMTAIPCWTWYLSNTWGGEKSLVTQEVCTWTVQHTDWPARGCACAFWLFQQQRGPPAAYRDLCRSLTYNRPNSPGVGIYQNQWSQREGSESSAVTRSDSKYFCR